jgi:hypothetical protein
MRNDINIIKNELIEQTNEKKQRELERKNKKEYEDFKKLCKWLVYTSIQASIDKGISIEDIYKQRKTLINGILADIKSKYIEIEDNNSWVDRKIKVREYPYPDYEIVDILSIIFEKEYLKVKKELKEEHLILKEDLKQKLIDELKYAINYCIEDGGLSYYVFKTFKEEKYKMQVIDNITDNDTEAEILESIYYQTLNEIKHGYDTTQKRIVEKEADIPLPWKILGITKVFKAIWKM